MNGEGGGAVGAEAAEVDESFDFCAGGNLCEGVRTFDVGGEEVAMLPQRFGAGKVIDLVDAAQGARDKVSWMLHARFSQFEWYKP